MNRLVTVEIYISMPFKILLVCGVILPLNNYSCDLVHIYCDQRCCINYCFHFQQYCLAPAWLSGLFQYRYFYFPCQCRGWVDENHERMCLSESTISLNFLIPVFYIIKWEIAQSSQGKTYGNMKTALTNNSCYLNDTNFSLDICEYLEMRLGMQASVRVPK